MSGAPANDSPFAEILMHRLSVAFGFVALFALGSSSARAQAAAAIAPAKQQIAEAVTPLPEELRAGAAVLGYNADGKLVPMRDGKNDMICLAPEPAAKAFHSACYHRAMEPFMARGRALRDQGVKGAQVDTVRFAEVKSGKLKMPTQATMLYQIFGGTFDPATEKVSGGSWLYVTYIPYATPATTGLSAKASEKGPWIMYPGTPKAHIMFSVGM
jgi:hypothetical protein